MSLAVYTVIVYFVCSVPLTTSEAGPTVQKESSGPKRERLAKASVADQSLTYMSWIFPKISGRKKVKTRDSVGSDKHRHITELNR